MVFASINPATNRDILTDQLRRLSPAYCVIPSEGKGSVLVRTIVTANPDARILVAEDESWANGILRWDGSLAPGSQSNPGMPAELGRVCYLNFTSGTTGLPKAALGTAANIYWNTRAAITAFDLTEADIHLCTFPSFLHPHELIARGLYLAGTSILIESEVRQVWNMLGQSNVTCIMSNASMFQLLVEYSRIVGVRQHP